MIVVTGGAGFIGSAVTWGLNQRNVQGLLLVDEEPFPSAKQRNLEPLSYTDYLNKNEFRRHILQETLEPVPEAIVHLGACSSTTEEDMEFLRDNNYQYTVDLAEYCLKYDTRFIYASSAATYGDGSLGYSDDHDMIPELEPLNKYGRSKQLFDELALEQGWLNEIVGLKYFNVYGPNEYHKGQMRSVIHKSVPQARENGVIRLFKSHREEYKHGEQKRDFLYVKDAVDMTLFFLDNPELGGIYNVGVGEARTFNDLARAIFDALEIEARIEYFDMPDAIRPNYQYYTEAELNKIRRAGYNEPITSLEDGIAKYVKDYILSDSRRLGETI